MTLLIPAIVREQLIDALKVGGTREIGGVLMAEHVGVDTFRLKSITVQLEGGTFARFVRLVENIIKPLRDFFRATNHDYARFNYLGEWHSHHSFELIPSGTDRDSMLDILSQPNFGARFVVLLLVRLDERGRLEHSVTVYQPGHTPFLGHVTYE